MKIASGPALQDTLVRTALLRGSPRDLAKILGITERHARRIRDRENYLDGIQLVVLAYRLGFELHLIDPTRHAVVEVHPTQPPTPAGVPPVDRPTGATVAPPLDNAVENR